MSNQRWWYTVCVTSAWLPLLYGCSSSSAGGSTQDASTTCTNCESSDTGTTQADTGSSSADSGAGDAIALPPWDGSVLGQKCPSVMDTTPCFTCEDNFCCDTEAACLNDPDCKAYVACLGNCLNGIPDDAGVHDSGLPPADDCDFYCYSAHPEGLSHFAPRDACVQQYCTQQCSGSPPNGCAACVNTNCAAQQAAAYDTVDGYLFNVCGANCATGDATCIDACQAQYPDTQAANTALLNCVGMYCSSASTCN